MAAEIHSELRRLCDGDLLHRLVGLSHDEDSEGSAALRVLEALIPYAAEAVIHQLSTEADRSARRELVELFCARAQVLAPSLVSKVGEDQEWYVTRNLILIIGIIIVIALFNRWAFNIKRKRRRDYYRNVYLKSDNWRRKRYVVLKRDNWRCVYCDAHAT